MLTQRKICQFDDGSISTIAQIVAQRINVFDRLAYSLHSLSINDRCICGNASLSSQKETLVFQIRITVAVDRSNRSGDRIPDPMIPGESKGGHAMKRKVSVIVILAMVLRIFYLIYIRILLDTDVDYRFLCVFLMATVWSC